MTLEEQIAAARELLAASKRTLQLVDEHLVTLQGGRVPLLLPYDVPSEHRFAVLNAIDDLDQQPGVNMGEADDGNNFGFSNPKSGTFRNAQDAAFVCTDILAAVGFGSVTSNVFSWSQMDEGPDYMQDNLFSGMLRLTDGSSGRSLITGSTQAPVDLDRGAVPLSLISSMRPGLGALKRESLFSEFTIPRGGTVKAQLFNVGHCSLAGNNYYPRVCLALLGYKVYGG